METSLKNVAHFNWRDVMDAKGETPSETIEALDKHFSMYAAIPLIKEEGKQASIGNIPCIKCGDIQNSGIIGAILGNGFERGLQHGEGHCKNCGWPATYYHFIKDKNGEQVITIRNFILQYHPDFVETKRRKSA